MVPNPFLVGLGGVGRESVCVKLTYYDLFMCQKLNPPFSNQSIRGFLRVVTVQTLFSE
jgi:hypothetical protein